MLWLNRLRWYLLVLVWLCRLKRYLLVLRLLQRLWLHLLRLGLLVLLRLCRLSRLMLGRMGGLTGLASVFCLLGLLSLQLPAQASHLLHLALQALG